MANTLTLTSLAADIFNARDTVAREAVGAISSVLVNTGSETAAYGDTVRSFVTAAPTLNTSYTPAMTIPAGDDQTVSSLTLTIDTVANVRIPLTGENIKHLDNGAGAEKVRVDMFKQAFRKITNTIEAYVNTQLSKGASRAVGTAATTPFASTHGLVNSARQILFDNGAPVTDGETSIILDSSAGLNFRNLSNLFKVNEGGDSGNLLRKGELTTLSGFSIKETGQANAATAGTMASATSTSAAFTVGQTSIPLATAGTGVVAAGDLITFANDTNIYVIYAVSFAGANPASGDTITLANPGLRLAQGVATRAITVKATSTRNLAIHRACAELVMRAPAQPYGGDAAVDRMTLSDDKSGLNFEVALYKGYGMQMFDITTFYTCKVWKPEFAAIILG